MYANDYSDWPRAIALLMSFAAAGAALIGMTPIEKLRSRAIKGWMIVPAVLIIGLYECHVLRGDADATLYAQCLMVIVVGFFSAPWVVAAMASFAISNAMRRRCAARNAVKIKHDLVN